jgi:sugar lactone lactonase YvrE
MKKAFALFLIVIVTCFIAPGARAQFTNFPAADRVLGASDFITAGPTTTTSSSLVNPTGLAIDPVSGKLFVTSISQRRILRFANTASLASGANAEMVFGQTDFTSGTSGSTASTLSDPYDIHVDRSGRLWVADSSNNRVLMYENASSLSSFGAAADLVLGQPDFDTVTPGSSRTKMFGPLDIFVDTADNLWVSDYDNHRVLKFANVSSLSNGAEATTVLGQPDFDTVSPGTSAVKMQNPAGLAIDGAGRLWVTEENNHRILRFDNAASLGNGAAANGVLGQTDFTSSTFGLSATAVSSPSDIAIDSNGTIYLADHSNGRVLIHKNPAAKGNGAAADGVIGQADFTTKNTLPTERHLAGVYSGMAFDPAGHLWVGDYDNHRVLRFLSDRSAASAVLVGKAPKKTTREKLVLKGTAADLNGISRVQYRLGKGAFKIAAGTTAWRISTRLKPGKNTIEIVAVDSVGNVSPAKRVKVKRL